MADTLSLHGESPLGKRRHKEIVTSADIEAAWGEFDIALQEVMPKKLSLTEQLIEQWIQRRNLLMRTTHINNSHICSKNRCVDMHFIETIDRKERIFGCLYSGRVHVCTADDAACYAQYTDANGMRICILSAVELGPMRENNSYSKKPDTGRDDEGNVSEYEMPDDDDLDQEDPEDDLDEKTRQFAGGEGWMDDDSETEKKPKTPGERLTKKIKTRMAISEESKEELNVGQFKKLNEDASLIIEYILFTPGTRRKLNDQREPKSLVAAQSALDKYYKECNGMNKTPNWWQAKRVYQTALDSFNMFLEIEHDQERLQIYSKAIIALWRAMSYTNYFRKNRSNFHFKQHVIASLYMMKKGLSFGSYQLFSADPLLKMGLPHKSDLHLFTPSHYSKAQQYSKSAVTQGTKNIHNCLAGLNLKENPNVLGEFEQIRTLLGI